MPRPDTSVLASLVILVIGWTIYVFVVRVCVRMIQGRALSVGRGGPSARVAAALDWGCRRTALTVAPPPLLCSARSQVAFVVIFFLLLGMFAWSYIRVLTASPGDARDVRPVRGLAGSTRSTAALTLPVLLQVVSSGIEGRPYEAFPSQPISEALESPSQPLQQQNPSDIEMRESHESYATSSFPDLSTSPSPASPPTPLPPTSLSHPDPRPHDTLLAQAPGNVPAKVRKGTLCASPRNRRAGATSSEETKFEELERRPPRPEEAGRWCQHCQLAKPLRTHQCVTQPPSSQSMARAASPLTRRAPPPPQLERYRPMRPSDGPLLPLDRPGGRTAESQGAYLITVPGPDATG